MGTSPQVATLDGCDVYDVDKLEVCGLPQVRCWLRFGFMFHWIGGGGMLATRGDGI